MKLPILEVRTSTAVDAFIGFTVMPKASRGKRYRLVEVKGDEESPNSRMTSGTIWVTDSPYVCIPFTDDIEQAERWVAAGYTVTDCQAGAIEPDAADDQDMPWMVVDPEA